MELALNDVKLCRLYMSCLYGTCSWGVKKSDGASLVCSWLKPLRISGKDLAKVCMLRCLFGMPEGFSYFGCSDFTTLVLND